MAAPAIPLDGALIKLRVEELKTLCGGHGLSTAGLKKDLVDRLKEKRDGGGGPPPPPGGDPGDPPGGPPPDPMEEVAVACGKNPEVTALVRAGVGNGPGAWGERGDGYNEGARSRVHKWGSISHHAGHGCMQEL